MEFWNTHPTESDLSFAKVMNSFRPPEATQNCVPGPKSFAVAAKDLPDMISDHINFELLPPLNTIKSEKSLSPRSKRYNDWLKRLGEIADKLCSGREASKNGRMSELLKVVMVELEHKLALDEFETETSECSFWTSVQNLAKIYGIDFSEFENICGSSFLKDAPCPMDVGIPSLANQGHIALPSGFGSGFLAGYTNAFSSADAFQQYPRNTEDALLQYTYNKAPKDVAYTSANLAPFEKSYNNHATFPSVVKPPDQGHLRSHGTSICAFSTPMPALLQKGCKGVVSMGNGAPLKEENGDCISSSLNTITSKSQLKASRPEACRRRTQRQRKRAINYHHLFTKFGVPPRPAARNEAAGAVDLLFLLEKKLKPSDVSSLGRIVLPKKQTEENLPYLDVKEGVTMPFQDLQTSQIWDLRFRYWPNNRTRMYLLESTGSFVKLHQLHVGDFLVLYRNLLNGTHVISFKKAARSSCLGISMRENLVPRAPAAEFIGIEKSKLEFTESSLTKIYQNGNNSKSFEMQQIPSDSWDTDNVDVLIKELFEMGTDGRSIDEIFDFKD